MGTTSEQTTVEFRTADGESSGPIPMDEFEERARGAAGRLREERNGQRAIDVPRTHELSFTVSHSDKDAPDFASVKIGGSMLVGQDLHEHQGFVVRVTTLRGEVVCEGTAAVTNVGFPEKTDSHGITTVERVHTLTLE